MSNKEKKDANNARNRKYYRTLTQEERKVRLVRTQVWRKKNPNCKKLKYASDFGFRFTERVSALVRQSLRARGHHKNSKTVVFLGCSLTEFRTHIEKQFWPGMGWRNQVLWHLDHIKPCASFDLADPVQQAACFHWSNWQPLWADDNMAKSDRLDWHHAESKHSLPTRLALKPWDCEGLGKPTLRE